MAYFSDNTPADRFLGSSTNMHPRRNGEEILTPEDVLEALGNFAAQDEKGNPVGWTLGSPEAPDGRHVYVGRTPGTCSRQTTSPLPYDRPSHIINYALGEGQPPPNPSTPILAEIPRAERPYLRQQTADSFGYLSSTPISPYWYAWAYVRRGKLTLAGPATPFHLATGQAARVAIPEDIPEDVHELALLLSAPRTSRPERPGAMRVQKIIDLRSYHLPYYELTGPYRYDGLLAPTVNQTTLPTPPKPYASFRLNVPQAGRVASYMARVSWCDENGETIPGPVGGFATIVQSSRWTLRDKDGKITFLAGQGQIRVFRPQQAPPGATGWRCYLYMTPIRDGSGFSAGWRRVYNKFSQKGDATPLPLSTLYVSTSGWGGDEEHYAGNDTYVVRDVPDLPQKNTTGLAAPESEPEPPEVFGAARPDPGPLYVRTTDVVRGVESLPSEASAMSVTQAQVASVQFVTPENRIPNGSLVETDPDALPLYWTVDKTGGDAKLVAGELLIHTNVAQAGVTPSAATPDFPVDPARTGILSGEYAVDLPSSGVIEGSAQLVLRQFDAAGVATDTVLRATGFAADNVYDNVLVRPAGSVGTAWLAGTVRAQLVHRMAGVTKNMRLRVRTAEMREESPRPRLEREGATRPVVGPRPVLPAPAGKVPAPSSKTPPARTILQDPPEPPWTPETTEVPGPDRPKSFGVVRDNVNFDAGIPADLTQTTTGGATLLASAAAAISGALGLQAKKAVGGALGSAYLSKTYPVEGGFPQAHAQGCYLRNRIPTFPASGSISMHAIVRPSDGQPIAWLEASSTAEIAELVLEEGPVQGGNVQVTLDKVAQDFAVSATAEVAELTLNAPTAPGVVSIGLNGVQHFVEAGGTSEIVQIDLTKRPTTDGYVHVSLGGVTRAVRVYKRDTLPMIAQRIKQAGWPGWDVYATVATLQWHSIQPGPRIDPSFNPGSTNMTATVRVHVQGASETAAQLAERIRGTSFPNWTTSLGATANVVRFTSVAGGLRKDATYSPGATGATGTMVTVTQGAIDTAEDLAARIRAGVFTGWTVSGAGRTVRWTATTTGLRQAALYDPRLTGASGRMRTVRQGTNADLSAYAAHASGELEYRKVIEGIGAATIFNTDITVSGAGTDRASIHVWASVGADPLKLVARFDGVNLTGYPAGTQRIGVFAESSADLTWELHTDEVRVSDRGLTWFREHDARGVWINQAVGYYRPTQPTRQDLFLQPAKTPKGEDVPAAAVIPGASYTISAFARADVPGAIPLRPLVVTAHETPTEDRSRIDPAPYHELGDVTNSPGLTGKSGWTEHKFTFVVPKDCHLITLASRDVGHAEIVAQEVVCSPGAFPLRTLRYATRGEYASTFDSRTPNTGGFDFWTKKRIDLGAATDAPDGTTLTVAYRSAKPDPANPAIPGVFSLPTADPALVPDAAFAGAVCTATGNGIATPVIRSGSPHAEYMTYLGPKRISVFLHADRSELPGGTAFARVEGWSRRPVEGRRRLPSGVLQDDPTLFPPIGVLPEAELLVFNEKAKKIVEEHWKDPYAVELFGLESLTIKLTAPPTFVRETVVVDTPAGTRERYSIWKAKLAPSDVLRSAHLPL